MTVSEAVIKWLKSFNPAEYWKMGKIDTDIQSAEVETYSVMKEPIRNIKSYISGRKIITDHYMIQARLASQTNTDRIDNNGFGEALEDWVSQQNKNKNFPDITDAAVTQVSVTTPFCIGSTAKGNSIYQMTVSIKYEKER